MSVTTASEFNASGASNHSDVRCYIFVDRKSYSPISEAAKVGRDSLRIRTK